MAKVFTGRYAADVEGDFVVFLIGMRINKPWNVRGWWHTFATMRPMIKELEANPELGLISAHLAWSAARPSSSTGARYEHLDRYARNADKRHLPAWKKWNQASRGVRRGRHLARDLQGARAAEYEVVYGNMPRLGLASRRGARAGHRRRAARPRGGSARRRRTSPRSPTPATDAGFRAPGHLRRAVERAAHGLSGRAISSAVAGQISPPVRKPSANHPQRPLSAVTIAADRGMPLP